MVIRKTPPLVFFNASVVLAGLYSPSGGSAKLLKWTKQKLIRGLISEIVMDEVLRHTQKIGFIKEQLQKDVTAIFHQISPAPSSGAVREYYDRVLDLGDAHILASCKQLGVDFLVTLDKKHLLSLSEKIKTFKIVSPKQLIEFLS